VAAPAVPADDDRADDDIVVHGKDQRGRVALDQAQDGIGRVRRAVRILSGRGPELHHVVGVGRDGVAVFDHQPAVQKVRR
jgi:hypothetical protein